MIDKVLLLHQALLADGRPIVVTGAAGTGKSACIGIALGILKPAYEPTRILPATLRHSSHPAAFDRGWLDSVIEACLHPPPGSEECTAGRKCLIFDAVPCGEWIDCVAQLALRPGHYMGCDFTPISAASDGPDRGVKVIVECVGPLDSVTPSLVSHFALVHLGADDLGWPALVHVWLERKGELMLRQRLQTLVEKYMEGLLSFRRSECRTVVNIGDVSVVRTFCQLCDSLLAPFDTSKIFRPQTGEERLERWSEALGKVFFFCAVWSIAGSLDDADGSRGKYDLFLREQHPEAGYPLKGNVYQFYVELPEGAWRPWETKLPAELSVNGAVGERIYRRYVKLDYPIGDC